MPTHQRQSVLSCEKSLFVCLFVCLCVCAVYIPSQVWFLEAACFSWATSVAMATTFLHSYIQLYCGKIIRNETYLTNIPPPLSLPRSPPPLPHLQASTQLANTQTAYSHHAIDYAYQINTVTCIKGHEILDNVSRGVVRPFAGTVALCVAGEWSTYIAVCCRLVTN